MTEREGERMGKSHRFSFPAPEVFQLGLWAGPIWWAAPEPMFRGGHVLLPSPQCSSSTCPGCLLLDMLSTSWVPSRAQEKTTKV